MTIFNYGYTGVDVKSSCSYFHQSWGVTIPRSREDLHLVQKLLEATRTGQYSAGKRQGCEGLRWRNRAFWLKLHAKRMRASSRWRNYRSLAASDIALTRTRCAGPQHGPPSVGPGLLARLHPYHGAVGPWPMKLWAGIFIPASCSPAGFQLYWVYIWKLFQDTNQWIK